MPAAPHASPVPAPHTSSASAPPVYRTELTPLSMLERSATVFADKDAIVYGERRMTFRDLAAAATRIAHTLRRSGIQPGDRVAYLLPNIPEMLVAHYAVPLAGAILVAINTRLSAEEVTYILNHSGAKILVADAELAAPIASSVGDMDTVTEIVTLTDPAAPAPPSIDGPSYEDFAARGSDEPLPWTIADETATISINYTSGTTGRPKGVMYHHRGAYLNALAEIVHSRFTLDSVYLWTLPMFHCNGWCTPWAAVSVGATQVCLRTVDGDKIWQLIDAESVTHFNGAPVVLATVANHPNAHAVDRPFVVTTAAAPPNPATIGKIEALGMTIVHVYGLTETYGPHTLCEWQPGWPDLDIATRTRLLSRQGVAMFCADPIRVVDKSMADVPADGTTMGEVVMRGNNVMTGYFNDPDATAKAFAGGWFHSGDLGVMHPDGYIELRDRAKDIVISGGENISTIEVEQAILTHPAVDDVAVIGAPDETWGERPKAFVVLKDHETVDTATIIEHVRGLLAHYKAPRDVQFVAALPKSSTGKIQKSALRQQEWAGQHAAIHG